MPDEEQDETDAHVPEHRAQDDRGQDRAAVQRDVVDRGREFARQEHADQREPRADEDARGELRAAAAATAEPAAAVACVAAYECRLFRASNGESVGVVTIDEPNRVVPFLVLPLGDAVVVCSEQGTEALRFRDDGTLANRVVTSKVFDCAARLGDRCLGAGPAGAASFRKAPELPEDHEAPRPFDG